MLFPERNLRVEAAWIQAMRSESTRESGRAVCCGRAVSRTTAGPVFPSLNIFDPASCDSRLSTTPARPSNRRAPAVLTIIQSVSAGIVDELGAARSERRGTELCQVASNTWQKVLPVLK